MKIKIMCIALCALFCFGTAQAQPPRMDPEQRIQQMITSLEVTKEQEPQFREVMGKINEKRSAAFQEMRNGGGDRSTMMAKMQELNAEAEKMLATVLTDAQMAKYKEQQAARRGPPR